MPTDLEQLTHQLWQMIDRHTRDGQIAEYGPETLFYHRGLYSHAPAVWFQQPRHRDRYLGPYDITAHPATCCRLAVLNEQAFDDLIAPLSGGTQSREQALARLCPHLRTARSHRVDGFACHPAAQPERFNTIVLFDPLSTLQLHDICQVER